MQSSAERPSEGAKIHGAQLRRSSESGRGLTGVARDTSPYAVLILDEVRRFIFSSGNDVGQRRQFVLRVRMSVEVVCLAGDWLLRLLIVINKAIRDQSARYT